MWIALGLLIGALIGFFLPYKIPVAFSKYVSVSFLAGLDSVLGGTRAGLEQRFQLAIFVSGFIANLIMAGLLTYIGDMLGADLYLAAVVTFGVRIFQNLAYIRRDLLGLTREAEQSNSSNVSGS